MKRIVGRNLSTPCCQTLTPNRKVVFEYKVPKVFVCKSDTFFWVHPVVLLLLNNNVCRFISE